VLIRLRIQLRIRFRILPSSLFFLVCDFFMTFYQCSGSVGIVCFWASRICIRYSEVRIRGSGVASPPLLCEASDADPDPNPDPHVFGPPGSGSDSTSQRYGSGSGSCSGSGSGSFSHHAKIVRKTLIPTILLLFLTFIFENYVNVSKSNKQKKIV